MRPTNTSEVAGPSPPERVLRPRHAITVGWALVSLLVIAVATLTPTAGWERESANLCLLCGDQWAADVLSNVLLFAPLGASLAAMGVRRNRAFLLGALLSCAIELAQLWIPGRDSSVTDVLANSLGTLLGLAVAATAPVWLRPSAVAARRLSLLWGAGASSVMAGAVLLFQPSFPPRPYFGMWTPELANIQWYRGRVLAAHVGSAPVANGAIANAPAVRAAMVARGPIVVRAIAGPPPGRLSELFGVTDDEQRNLVFLGPYRTDLVLHLRMRAALLGLEQPQLIRAAGLLQQVHRGDTVTVVATASKGTACLSVDAQRVCQRTPGAASGWRLVQSGDDLPGWLISTLDALWLIALALPLGYWPRGWRDGLPGAMLILAALAGIQLWMGRVELSNWLWIAMGLGAGAAARSAPGLFQRVGGQRVGHARPV
jgi:VanZ family protein